MPLSRYADPAIASGDLDTSVVAVITDVIRGGRPVVGLGYGSVGRYAQGGLIRARFAPRLLQAPDGACADASTGNLDPALAWRAMMAGEKPAATASAASPSGRWTWPSGMPPPRSRTSRYAAISPAGGRRPPARVPVYAGGGYLYPRDDEARLADEARACVALGFNRIKIKIGGADLDADRRRIETVLARLPTDAGLAVDAMNAYGPGSAQAAARALSGYGLWWFEDICDPLDFETLADVAASYPSPIAAGEALFSPQEARCWRGMAACVRIAMYWSSIPRIATA